MQVQRKCFTDLRWLKDVLSVSTKLKLYNAIVLPYLDYCSVVWHECLIQLKKKVERIHLMYGMQLILSQPSSAPSDELRQALRRIPLERRRGIC